MRLLNDNNNSVVGGGKNRCSLMGGKNHFFSNSDVNNVSLVIE